MLLWTRRDRSLSSKNGAIRTPVDAERSVSDLKQDYETALASFKGAEGEILRAYWCSGEASAVVLTEKEKTNRFNWLSWRRVGSFELHRATDWVTEEAPRIAELLHSGDTLTIRINRVLNATSRRIAMEWVFSEQSYLLGFVDGLAGSPCPKSSSWPFGDTRTRSTGSSSTTTGPPARQHGSGTSRACFVVSLA